MENKCPKVSIIIPVYNVEQYLQQCIDSVINQAYQNLEIILVDDGSTDGSGEICDVYVKMDNRIKVIHKANTGVAFARESGLQAMTGDYIMFVDSDDWIDAETVSACLQAIEKYPDLDLVLFSYIKEYEDHVSETHLFDKDLHMKGRALEHRVYRRLFGLSTVELVHPERMETMASCWGKLYTAETVANARHFDIKDIGSSEDALFNMYALYGIKEAVYIDRGFYHYRKRKDAQTAAYRPNLQKQWKNLFSVMEGIIDEKQLNDSYKDVLSNRIALSITAIALNELHNKNHSAIKHIGVIKRYLSDEAYQRHCHRMSVRYMPVPWKVLMLCAKMKLAFPIYSIAKLISIIK